MDKALDTASELIPDLPGKIHLDNAVRLCLVKIRKTFVFNCRCHHYINCIKIVKSDLQ